MCPTGHFCASTNMPPVECGNGKYSSTVGVIACTSCPAGFECQAKDGSRNNPCPLGSFSLLGDAQCTLCEAGKMCPRTDSALQIDCEPGTYSKSKIHSV